MYHHRKRTRLACHNYSSPGYYFITVCTKDKKPLLCRIVGTDVLGGPKSEFTEAGILTEKQLHSMASFYEQISIEKYVIMPNHVHLLLHITREVNGPSGRPVPTNV